jgi:Tetracyclin repressor-like, C-terminal domain
MRPDLAFLGASEMRSLEQPDSGRIAARRRAVQHLLDAEIDAAISAGLARTPAPRETARAIVSMCTALPQWFDPRGRMSARDAAALHARLALDMIGGA